MTRKESFNILVLGMIGSGKSQINHRLIAQTPRAIIFDRIGEYAEPDVAFGRDRFREGAEFFLDNRNENFQIVVQGGDDVFSAWMRLVYKVQREDLALPPLAIYMDEASYYTSSHDIPPEVADIYERGRHARLNVVTSVQRITRVHTVVRDQSHAWIVLRLNSTPAELGEQIPPEEREIVRGLEPLRPGVAPEYGTHYISTLGAGVDVFERWRRFNPGSIDDGSTNADASIDLPTDDESIMISGESGSEGEPGGSTGGGETSSPVPSEG